MIVFYNNYGQRQGTCNSGDTKPVGECDGFSIPHGSVLYEVDTQTVYMYDAEKASAGDEPWTPQN